MNSGKKHAYASTGLSIQIEDTVVTEVFEDVYRISTYIKEHNIVYNQFLLKDEKPLLFHTGMNCIFPQVLAAVSKIIDPATIGYISFSHFEPDEMGSILQWVQVAPQAEVICNTLTSFYVQDYGVAREPNAKLGDNAFETGKYRFRFFATGHVPHCWDAGLLFEETQRILFCSDILLRDGKVEPIDTADPVGPYLAAIEHFDAAGLGTTIVPFTPSTESIYLQLADLKPRVLLPMHGATYLGDGAKVLEETLEMIKTHYQSKPQGQ